MFEKTLAALIAHSEDPGSNITYQDTISEGGVAKASLSSYISQRGALRNMDQDEKSWFLSAYPGIDYVEGNVNKRGNKEGVFMYHGPDFKAPVRILDPSSADEGVLNTQEEMDDLDSGVSTKVLPPDLNLS